MELQEALLQRRSVRKYTDHQVTDEEIAQVLEAARWAPSWANTQVWEFIVIRGRERIDQVVGTYSPGNPATKGSLAASVLIAACARKGVSGCKTGGEATRIANWFLFDMGMAVQNLCLKAHELGLGSVVVALMDHAACAKLLSVPEDFEVVAVIPLGRPVEVKAGPPRKELKSFVHLNRFGELFLK